MDEISEKSKSSAGRRSKEGQQSGSRGASAEENKNRDAEQQRNSKTYHPIKLVIPPNKSRLIFFSKVQDQAQWISRL